MGVRTGTLIGAALTRDRNSYGKTVLLDIHSKTPYSQYFEVRDFPLVIQLYGATDGQQVTLLSAYGSKAAAREQVFLLDGVPVQLDATNNTVVVSTAGRYRVQLVGDKGTVLCVCGPQMGGGYVSPEIPQPSGVQANRPNLFLDGNNLSATTQVIEIASTPWLFSAYGMGVGEYIEVFNTYGWGDTYREELFRLEGTPVRLTSTINAIILSASGRYRFKLTGSLDNKLLVGNPTTARLASDGSLTPEQAEVLEGNNITTIAATAPTDGDILEFSTTDNAWKATKAPRELYLDGGNF